jgi:hypothetical protein
LIISFFAALFAALTIYWQWHVSDVALGLPFADFAIIGLIAACIFRLPGKGVRPSAKAERAIM